MSRSEHDDDQPQGRFRIGLWRKILSYARPYSAALAGLAGAGLVVAAIDALLPWVTGRIIDDATGAGKGGDLLRHSLDYLGLVAIMSFLIWAFVILAGQIATGYAYSIRRAAFARLQELSFSFYDRRPVGWLMARMTSDCGRLADIIPWFLLDLTWGIAFIAGITGMMFWLNSGLALCVIVIVPPLVAASAFFQRKILRTQRAVRKANSQITAAFHEAITGVRTTKSLVREEENLEEFQGLTGAMYNHALRGALLSAGYLPIVLTLGSLGVGLALWRGGLRIDSGLSLGTLVAFMQYAAFFYIPIQELAGRLTDIQAAQASAERLQGLLDEVPEIRDSAAVAERVETHRQLLDRGRQAEIAADGLEQRIEEIEFRDVSFAYKEGEPVLQGFNLRVRRGETVALVGATGGGKTTVVSLLNRFYEPTGGRILVNGVDCRARGLRWYQSQFGVVLQAPHLFSGTVRENIRYGRAGATDEDVVQAARRANAHDFICALDRGYDTEVGEGGGRLSVGQKQLVALARAVLADPQILILDEATSSVDTETERLIQSGIHSLLEGRISFIVAHRLSTIRRAGRILVIDHGRVAEEGSHEELIRRRGHYYRLYTNQFARQEEDELLEGAEEAIG